MGSACGVGVWVVGRSTDPHDGAGRGRKPCGSTCWSRETYEFIEVWRDGDATQYGLGSLNSNLPGVGKAATPETSPMSLGFRPAEHEGEQGVKHWRDGRSGERSPPERRRRTGGDKGRSPSSPKVPMSERSTAKVQQQHVFHVFAPLRKSPSNKSNTQKNDLD